ncbi:uncharacterized protein LOC126743162 [Anthonomus grandis grandis]|uniref:uncharacterized protein LOC126743162 n=1 Tax=Anthonomus grandis grandis TaxID=2921223 RepID=UPI00216623C2|nr:uncharacterized protein LOC126743162 [Anthonomus grandis grandis]
MSICFVYCALFGSILFLGVKGRIPEGESFENSFEDTTKLSPEFRKSLLLAEDTIVGFVNKLVNTGYKSSKIALNRAEKERTKRRELGDKVEELLSQLPTFDGSKIVDQMMIALEIPAYKPTKSIQE